MFERSTLEPDPASIPRIARLGDLLSDWEADAIAATAARVNGTARGALTGLPKLDGELGGALSTGLHIIHGGPGIGKTAFCLQVAAQCCCPAVYVSCEMPPLELLRRHTARVTNTYLSRLKSGELPPTDSLNLARRAAAAAPELCFVDATRAAASPTWLQLAAERERGTSRHLLIVIDSVHSWANAVTGELPEYEALGVGLSALQRLAASLECAVIGIAERNRASMNGGGLSAAAGNRRFEYGAESVIGLDRNDKAAPDASGECPLTAVIEKNRNGSPGRRIPLRFHGALQRFTEA